MNNVSATLTIIVFFAIVALSAYFSIRWGWKAEQSRLKRQQEAEKIALRCNPAYAQMEERDRAYHLARERQIVDLALKQAEFQLEKANFQLKQYLALHRIPAETYSINEEIRTSTAFPSLRVRSSQVEQEAHSLLETRYTQPSHEELINSIRPNSYTYSPGINAQTGEPVVVDLVKVPHLKILVLLALASPVFVAPSLTS